MAIPEIASMFAGQQSAKEQTAGRKSPRAQAPVFVIGCSRSGATLLYPMILSSGNFAVYRHESHAFNLLDPRFRPLCVARQRQKLLDFWFTTDLFVPTGLDKTTVATRFLAEGGNLGDFLRIFMEEMCRKQGVERWADTTPEHLLYLRRIKQMIPNALIVHVIRDGRDVAASWEKLSQLRKLPWDHRRPAMAAAIYWERFVSQGSTVGRTLGNDCIEVHYQDLVRDPVVVLQRLEPFLEHRLDYEEILKNPIGSVSKPNTAFRDKEASPVGRWKSVFTAEEIETLEALVGETLDGLGYETQTASWRQPPAPTPAPVCLPHVFFRQTVRQDPNAHRSLARSRANSTSEEVDSQRCVGRTTWRVAQAFDFFDISKKKGAPSFFSRTLRKKGGNHKPFATLLDGEALRRFSHGNKHRLRGQACHAQQNYSVNWHASIDQPRPTINPSAQRLGVFKSLLPQPMRHVGRAHAVMADDDDMLLGIEFPVGASRDIGHG